MPIIFVTGATRAKAGYRAFTGYGTGAIYFLFIDFLFKPLDEHVLRAKVDVLISLERQRREAERAPERISSGNIAPSANDASRKVANFDKLPELGGDGVLAG